jgi:hypothetical protein
VKFNLEVGRWSGEKGKLEGVFKMKDALCGKECRYTRGG